MSECFSPEYKVLIWATDKLCTGFRSAHKTLCRKFLAKDLIPMQVEHMCNDNTVDRDTFVQAMVTTLQDRVRNDPNAYYTIIDILKDEIGISYLGDILGNKMTDRLEAEKTQRELGIMEAEKKHQKPEEDEHINKQLHNQDMTGQDGYLPSHRPEDMLTSKTEATERPQQASNATAIAQARGGAEELAYMRPHMIPFGGQKQVSCTEGGDILPLPASVQENMPEDRTDGSSVKKPTENKSKVEELKKMLQGICTAENQTKFEGRPNYDTLPSIGHLKTTPTIYMTKEYDANRVPKSNTTDKSAMLEHGSEQEMGTNREMLHGEGSRKNEEKEKGGLKKTWAEERTSKNSSKSAYLSVPNTFYALPISGYSHNSESFETPTCSPGSAIHSPTSPGGTQRKACSKCKYYKKKIEGQEESIKENLWLVVNWQEAFQRSFQRPLYEREEERAGMHMNYDTRHKKMNSITTHIQSILQNLTEQMNRNKDYEIVTEQISTHETQKEMETKEREIQKLKKEKDKEKQEKERVKMERDQAEKVRDQAEKERDQAKKERDQAEKERDWVQKERNEEKSQRLKNDLIHIAREIRRAKLLQCEDEYVECQESVG